MDRTTLSRNLKPLVTGCFGCARGGWPDAVGALGPAGEQALEEASRQGAQQGIVNALSEERYEALLGDVAK